MTFQIFKEIKPPQYQTVLMYAAPFGGNLGVQGTLLVVNQGNSQVNAGNIAQDYGRDSDFIRIGVANSYAASSNSYIAYDTLMPPNHMAQWQQLCLKSGEGLFVYSKLGQTSFVFTGTTFSA